MLQWTDLFDNITGRQLSSYDIQSMGVGGNVLQSKIRPLYHVKLRSPTH